MGGGEWPRQTRVLQVHPDGTSTDAIKYAAALLQAGRLVAFPTETVYGLGADASSESAVAGIFAAKERPANDPIIVHVSSIDELPVVARDIPQAAFALAKRFWPGPLTLVLPRAPIIPPRVTAGGSTVGVRVPSHPVAQALLRAACVPIAAPSANRFMHTSPTNAAHVLADLDGRIDCLLDGGPCPVGVESTVLDPLADPPRVLRPGGVTLEQLREVLPEVQGPVQAASPDVTLDAMEGEVARSPGQMARHYAPRAELLVFDLQGPAALAAISAEVRSALIHSQRVGLLLPDEEAEKFAYLPLHIQRLGPAGDLGEISRRLYAALRSLDEEHVDLILTHTFGTQGLGLALWDRLRRAAGGNLRS